MGRGKKGFIAVDNVRFRKGEECNITPKLADPRYEGMSKEQNFLFINCLNYFQII